MIRLYTVWVAYPGGKADLRLVKASSEFEAKIKACDGKPEGCKFVVKLFGTQAVGQ